MGFFESQKVHFITKFSNIIIIIEIYGRSEHLFIKLSQNITEIYKGGQNIMLVRLYFK